VESLSGEESQKLLDIAPGADDLDAEPDPSED
jgi:hypothetical protein